MIKVALHFIFLESWCRYREGIGTELGSIEGIAGGESSSEDTSSSDTENVAQGDAITDDAEQVSVATPTLVTGTTSQTDTSTTWNEGQPLLSKVSCSFVSRGMVMSGGHS